MKKLLLSFLFVGTVFVSCDKGDDIMTDAQVAADVKVLSIENPSDFDVFDLDGDDSAVSGKSGWTQYKQLVAPNGNKLVYYGIGGAKKETVLVLSFTNGTLSHYSIRNGDSKWRKIQATRDNFSFVTDQDGRSYSGGSLRKLISAATLGYSSNKASKAASRGGKYITAIDGLVDSNDDGWDDMAFTELEDHGFAFNDNFVLGNLEVGYEPSQSDLPYYLDGDVPSYVSGDDYTTVEDVIAGLWNGFNSIYSLEEVAELGFIGFESISAGSSDLQLELENIYINLQKHRLIADESSELSYHVFDEGNNEDFDQEYSNLADAIAAVNTLIAGGTPGNVESNNDGITPEGDRRVQGSPPFNTGDRNWITEYGFTRNSEYRVNGVPSLQYVLGDVYVSFFYYNGHRVVVGAPGSGFYAEYAFSDLDLAVAAIIAHLPAEVRYANEIAADIVTVKNAGFTTLQDLGHASRYYHVRSSDAIILASQGNGFADDQYGVYIDVNKDNSGYNVGAFDSTITRRFFGTNSLEKATTYANSLETLTDQQELTLNQMFNRAGQGLVRVANDEFHIIYESTNVRLVIPFTNIGMTVEDRTGGRGHIGYVRTELGQDGVFDAIVDRLATLNP